MLMKQITVMQMIKILIATSFDINNLIHQFQIGYYKERQFFQTEKG